MRFKAHLEYSISLPFHEYLIFSETVFARFQKEIKGRKLFSH